MPRIATQSSLVRVAIPVLVLAVVTSCATGTRVASPTPVAGAASSTPGAVPSAAPGASVSCPTGAWRPVPVGVTRHVAAPVMPVITGVRTAAHPECGYDRLVLDITGPRPSFEVRYVPRVTADPSGKPIILPGQRYLLITFQPAKAQFISGDSSGRSTARMAPALGYPVLKGYALAGDFEGVFALALGLGGLASIRIGELPGHWYIDVKT